jgi:hypothetical protein
LPGEGDEVHVSHTGASHVRPAPSFQSHSRDAGLLQLEHGRARDPLPHTIAVPPPGMGTVLHFTFSRSWRLS